MKAKRPYTLTKDHLKRCRSGKELVEFLVKQEKTPFDEPFVVNPHSKILEMVYHCVYKSGIDIDKLCYITDDLTAEKVKGVIRSYGWSLTDNDGRFSGLKPEDQIFKAPY